MDYRWDHALGHLDHFRPPINDKVEHGWPQPLFRPITTALCASRIISALINYTFASRSTAFALAFRQQKASHDITIPIAPINFQGSIMFGVFVALLAAQLTRSCQPWRSSWRLPLSNEFTVEPPYFRADPRPNSPLIVIFSELILCTGVLVGDSALTFAQSSTGTGLHLANRIQNQEQ